MVSLVVILLSPHRFWLLYGVFRYVNKWNLFKWIQSFVRFFFFFSCLYFMEYKVEKPKHQKRRQWKKRREWNKICAMKTWPIGFTSIQFKFGFLLFILFLERVCVRSSSSVLVHYSSETVSSFDLIFMSYFFMRFHWDLKLIEYVRLPGVHTPYSLANLYCFQHSNQIIVTIYLNLHSTQKCSFINYVLILLKFFNANI